MKKPLVAVVDWKKSPRGDESCYIEKKAIGSRAKVKYFNHAITLTLKLITIKKPAVINAIADQAATK